MGTLVRDRSLRKLFRATSRLRGDWRLISSKSVLDCVWFWQRSICYSPKGKDEVFAPSIHVVRVPTKSLKILIAALSCSVAYW